MSPEYRIDYFEALRVLGVGPASIAKAQGAVEFFFKYPPKNLDTDPGTYFSTMVEACQEGALCILELSRNGKGGDLDEGV
jgi:hypothetical protein